MPKIGLNILSSVAIKDAKPGHKMKAMRDGGGLYLVVEPSGKKWWKLRTTFAGKESSFSLGAFPDISLGGARAARDEMRKKMLVMGIDPAVARKEEKAKADGTNTFEAFAREWHGQFKSKWSEGHARNIQVRLERYVFPYIGKRPLEEITTPEMLAILNRIAAASPETARKTMTTLAMIYQQAARVGRVPYSPVDALRGALPPVKHKHMAAPTEPKDAAPLLRMLDSYAGTFAVKCALRLAPLVFVRPGELRQAEWAAIDLDAAEWRYQASKTGQDHIVPLSRQAVAILREIHPLTGTGRYVFPSARTASRPMSEAAVNAALRRMGIDTKEELTGHGFRAMARTILDEVLGFRPDIIELQLAHAVRDPLGRAYNRTKHLPERKEMMQAWADYLDGLKAGA